MKKITMSRKKEKKEDECKVESSTTDMMDVMNDNSKDSQNELEIIYTINNHLYFYRDITEESSALFNKTLTEMYFDIVSVMISSGMTNPVIEIHIKSSGGELTAAMAMVKKIKELKSGFGVIPIPIKIITHIEGEACSAATLLAIVGSERTISEYSVMLIHDVLGGMLGKKEDIKDYVKNIELLSNLMKKIYIENSKLTLEDLDSILTKDIYFDAQTCLEYGLVDRIV